MCTKIKFMLVLMVLEFTTVAFLCRIYCWRRKKSFDFNNEMCKKKKKTEFR